MYLFKVFPVFPFILLATACASLVSGQSQDITVLTPGANEAECTLDNGLRYTVTTGETIQIMRNESDIVVECYAAGNRYRKMSIESDGNKWAVGNVATGIIPGVTFDHFSKGLYEYPKIITVDFVGVPTKGFELPEYHNKDAPNPYDQAVEDYGPNTPKLGSDGSILKNEVTKKPRVAADPFTTPSQNATGGQGNAITPLPGSVTPPPLVGNSAEELNRSMNPSVFRTN